MDVSKCSLGKLGLTALLEAFCINNTHSSTIQFLNISGNKLDTETSYLLGQALSRMNLLRKLNISNSGAIKLEPIMGALSKVFYDFL